MHHPRISVGILNAAGPSVASMSHLQFTVGRTYAIPILHTMLFVRMKEHH